MLSILMRSDFIYIPIQCITFILSILLSSYSLCSQCLVNPYQPLKTPAEELGLLPDTPSYYQEEEVFRNDSLVYTSTIMTLHNYGDHRFAAYNDEYAHAHFVNFVSLHQVDDSLWMQTSTWMYPPEHFTDTIFAWMKDGIVHRAKTTSESYKPTYQYRYNDIGQLVQKTKTDNKGDTTECWYAYADDKLVSMHCAGTNLDSQSMSIAYTDTLVTVLQTDLHKGRFSYSKRLYDLDTCGNILTQRFFYQSSFEQDFKSSGTASYVYHKNGTYHSSSSIEGLGVYETDYFHKPYPGYRYVVNGENVVRMRRNIRIY